MTQILNKDPKTYEIIGAAIEVHKIMGRGFLEAVYQEALSIEFSQRKIPYQKEVQLPIFYKDRRLSASYKADFVCYESVIVELKALANLSGAEESQVLNYLKASGMEIGLLLNFGTTSLQYKRFIFNERKSVESVKSVDNILCE